MGSDQPAAVLSMTQIFSPLIGSPFSDIGGVDKKYSLFPSGDMNGQSSNISDIEKGAI